MSTGFAPRISISALGVGGTEPPRFRKVGSSFFGQSRPLHGFSLSSFSLLALHAIEVPDRRCSCLAGDRSAGVSDTVIRFPRAGLWLSSLLQSTPGDPAVCNFVSWGFPQGLARLACRPQGRAR